MASSPQTPLMPATVTSKIPTTVTPLTITPASKIHHVSTTPSTNGHYEESVIWKRIGEANLTDDDSIRRRDQAALIAYIAKLETQINDLQRDMKLLIVDGKCSASKYEEAILSAGKAELKHLREQAGLSSTLAEARKREDSLNKSLGIEKECVANIEKALHEMRAESAEVKIEAESKMAESRSLAEDTQQKFIEAEKKLCAAESLRDEARRSERAAGRKLQEVEAREDDLRRRMASFKSNCDAKEKELMLERQSLVDRHRLITESQNKVLDSQSLLNQRETDILSKSQALTRLERELTDKKESIAAEMRAFAEQKSNLELNASSLSEREKVVVEKEVSLNLKERELLISQEMLASKKQNEMRKNFAEQEMALKRRGDEFDAQLSEKQKVVEEDIERKRRAWELKELDLKQHEDVILEKEQGLEVQSKVIEDKGKELAVTMKNIQEREYHLSRSESEVELTKSFLQKQREEIDSAKVDLEKSLISLKEEKKQISAEKVRFELMKSETSELLVLETKLKEEIDLIRAQKQQLDSEAEKLKVEKAKFETEWELIDVKREELRREEEQLAVKRMVIFDSLKDERDSLNLEKETLREQCKRDRESLTNDREALMSENQRERSDWFSKFQKEREDLLLEIECCKREMEDRVNKRREDIESYLQEKQRTFEEEKKRDLQHICSGKQDLIREQERVAAALKKFETEKLEIKVDREQRDKVWAELQSLIEELQLQRLKLKEQREMLHADREDILCQIKQLKKLENVKSGSDNTSISRIQNTCAKSSTKVVIEVPPVEKTHKHGSVIFKHPCEVVKQIESSLNSSYEYTKMGPAEMELLMINENFKTPQKIQMVGPIGNAGQHGGSGSEEPKEIHEVPCIVEETSPLEARKRRFDSTDADLQIDAKSKKMRQESDATHDGRMKQQQHSGDGQNVVSLTSQSERSTDKVISSLAEAEGCAKVTLETVNTGISCTQFQHNAVEKSALVEDKTLTCIIAKQTLIQELHVINDGETNKP